MKRQNTQSISEAIKLYFKAMGFEHKLNEVSVVGRWEEIIGKSVANHTDKIFIKEKTLYIKVDSSIVKQEILMLKSGIIQRFNELAKQEIVQKLVVF